MRARRSAAAGAASAPGEPAEPLDEDEQKKIVWAFEAQQARTAYWWRVRTHPRRLCTPFVGLRRLLARGVRPSRHREAQTVTRRVAACLVRG